MRLEPLQDNGSSLTACSGTRRVVNHRYPMLRAARRRLARAVTLRGSYAVPAPSVTDALGSGHRHGCDRCPDGLAGQFTLTADQAAATVAYSTLDAP